MKDEELNRFFAFSLIVLVIFTSGNVALFNFTLREKMFDAIEAEQVVLRQLKLLQIEYDELDEVYKLNLFDGSFFRTLYVFKDDYLEESHATISLFHSNEDVETLQWAIDHAQQIIGRGDFILTDSLKIGEAHDGLVLRDLRLWIGGLNISTRAPWYNESNPLYNPSGEEINKTTKLPVTP